MINDLFNKLYVINRSALTTDGVGGFTEAYGVQSNIYGQMTRKSNSGVDRIRVGAKEVLVTNVFYCESGSDILTNDTVTNGGQTWNVLSISEPGNRDHHLEVLCEEVLEGY